MDLMFFPRAVPVVVTTLLVFAARCHAQQEYTLGDDDTWRQGEAPDPTTPEGQLANARQLLASGDAGRAETIADEWIKRHERHAQLAEAHLLRGDARTAQGDEYQALFDYEYIARMHTGSEVFITALQRELEIAKQYARGMNRKLWGMRIADASDEAEEIFIRVQERMPGSRLAEEAGIELADFYFGRRQMALAVDAYALFIENYPDSPLVDKARRRLIYAHLASFKGAEFDASGLYEARLRLQELKKIRPVEAQKVGADAIISRIDESDAAKMLETARWYDRIGDPIAAELTIRRLVSTYQRSVAAADALQMIPAILEKLPSRVIEQAPDYAAMRSAMLGHEASPGPPATGSVVSADSGELP